MYCKKLNLVNSKSNLVKFTDGFRKFCWWGLKKYSLHPTIFVPKYKIIIDKLRELRKLIEILNVLTIKTIFTSLSFMKEN
jgi:hypothetical protein